MTASPNSYNQSAHEVNDLIPNVKHKAQKYGIHQPMISIRLSSQRPCQEIEVVLCQLSTMTVVLVGVAGIATYASFCVG